MRSKASWLKCYEAVPWLRGAGLVIRYRIDRWISIFSPSFWPLRGEHVRTYHHLASVIWIDICHISKTTQWKGYNFLKTVESVSITMAND